jgi:hypothetical protein
MEPYSQSVPGQMCLYWYDACINASGVDAAAQFQCTSDRDSQCGNKETGEGDNDASSTTLLSLSSLASLSSFSSVTLPFSTTTSLSHTTSSISNRPNSPPTSSQTSTTPSSTHDSAIELKKLAVSAGTIAGATVGSIGGLVIVAIIAFLLYRRKTRKRPLVHPTNPSDLDYDGKEVVDPSAIVMPAKPELDGNSTYTRTDLSQQAVHNTLPAYYPPSSGAAELHSTPQQHPSELYVPSHQSVELQGTGGYGRAEVYTSTLPSEMETPNPTDAPTHRLSSHHQPPIQPDQQQQPTQEVQELGPRSPESNRSVRPWQPSNDEIIALEEEERRIDAEMEEVRRMKELRDQKFAVQQKLREAKRN